MNCEDFIKSLSPSLSEDELDYIANKLKHLEFNPIINADTKKIIQNGEFQDFVYWKSGEAVIFNVNSEISHEMFLFYLHMVDYAIENNTPFKDAVSKHFGTHFDLSSRFISENRGFYMSSVSDKITISDSYKYSFVESKVFGQYEKMII